jgi:hypothetical protein
MKTFARLTLSRRPLLTVKLYQHYIASTQIKPVQAVDKATTETKGIQEAAKDAVPVPRHELERAQGRDVRTGR